MCSSAEISKVLGLSANRCGNADDLWFGLGLVLLHLALGHLALLLGHLALVLGHLVLVRVLPALTLP